MPELFVKLGSVSVNFTGVAWMLLAPQRNETASDRSGGCRADVFDHGGANNRSGGLPGG
ncbi:MAG: hypothetical protein QOD45_543, partial [Pseudonocardiales bacterium]|nr:hypothetical protein [Pseudonocardiales bacterium]